jgi:hypothetical protein
MCAPLRRRCGRRARTQVAQTKDAEGEVALQVDLLTLLHVALHQVIGKRRFGGGEADAESKGPPLRKAQHALRQRKRHGATDASGQASTRAGCAPRWRKLQRRTHIAAGAARV